MIKAEERRQGYVDYIRANYLGPAGGADETVRTRPDLSYLVGTLYPQGSGPTEQGGVEVEPVSSDDLDQEDDGEQTIATANAWRPSSAAMSFFHDGTEVQCTCAYGRYQEIEADGSRAWKRTQVTHGPFTLSESLTTFDVSDGDSSATVTSTWRRMPEGQFLVTVAIVNSRWAADPDNPRVDESLFQAELSAEISDGTFLSYRTTNELGRSHEEEELALRYDAFRTYGVGHGSSVRWEMSEGHVDRLSLDFLPSITVPAVAPRPGQADVLSLAVLGDAAGDRLIAMLSDFVDDYEVWVAEQSAKAEEESLPHSLKLAAKRIVHRQRGAVERMRDTIEVLRDDDIASAFRLAMVAMRQQMLQSAHMSNAPGVRTDALAPRPHDAPEPTWRPFQLGFLLLSLGSTAVASHRDRKVVDLIWFPTGGGKTEAYLALAAFEMIRRRLVAGDAGGGTAVITRYTLRLLTTQQFQRAATLVCALELMRSSEAALNGSAAFSIGLWLGDETTPNTSKAASERLESMLHQHSPENPFQLEACPWCATPIIPAKYTVDREAYGARMDGSWLQLYCPHVECPFHDALPVSVVDEQLYREPPTLLMATVDKFARLPMVEDAGALLGSRVLWDPPSLVIQDELHLLSGPLGTTVGLYEAAVQAVLGWRGVAPKIVASTATIRSADEQVRELFGRRVDLFPPSGLVADESYFATVDPSAPGRLYIGVMPQAFTQSSSVVRALTALLEAPLAVEESDSDRDAYCTVVAYHNSLRELGRTMTIVRDDVESMLRARASDPESRRRIRDDGVVELTSRVSGTQLPKLLAQLERPFGTAGAIDVAASTNMLSVGIDVSRLGVMLMNGQPKTTSEYIQATSRVGRSRAVPGLVVTLYRAAKARDRSHYESFQAYHEALYRAVEPTSITPWALQSRSRSLAGALVLLIRHGAGLHANSDCASFSPHDPDVIHAAKLLKKAAIRAEGLDHPSASAKTISELEQSIDDLVDDWARRATEAVREGSTLRYLSPKGPSLMKIDFGAKEDGWAVMSSMRSVDKSVRVLKNGEK